MKRYFSLAERAPKRQAETGDLSLEVAFSSESPYERWWGIEILDHGSGSVLLDRMNDGAPVLFNHDPNDLRGTHEPGSVHLGEDRVMRGTVRLTSATEAGREAIALVESGVLSKASVGYEILSVIEISKNKSGAEVSRELSGSLFERTLERTRQEHRGDIRAFQRALDAAAGTFERAGDDPPTYRVVKWRPFENSLVTIPADNTVGVGRGYVREVSTTPANPAETRSAAMTEKVDAAAGASAESRSFTDPVELEKGRKEAIQKICKANRLDERHARAWIDGGADLNKVADDLLAILEERGRTNPESVAKLDLSKSDVRRYSLLRAIRAATNKDWKAAGLELECNREIAARLNRVPKSDTSFFVPLDVMMRDLPNGAHQRDMTVAGVSGSNYLVQTDNQPQNFIDLLRNTSVGLRMGVQRLSGLRGNVTIPKMTAGNTAYWLADENTAITESQPTIGQLSLSPKNVAALTELSHQLMSQNSPDAETLVLTSIARDIGLAVDVGILRGSGSAGQPTGIVTTGGIGAFTGTSLASPGVLDAQADVAAANALFPGCGYVTTPAVAALLMQRPELPSTGTERLWKGNMAQGSIFDFPAMSSAQMATATALFGWWPSVVLAEWGVLELMVNPFSDFTRGLTAVRGWYTCDVGVRYPGAWSYSSSIT